MTREQQKEDLIERLECLKKYVGYYDNKEDLGFEVELKIEMSIADFIREFENYAGFKFSILDD